jgi:hypothetical protein
LVGMVPRLLLPYLRFCNKNGTVFFWPAWDGSSSSSSPAKILRQERYRFFGPLGWDGASSSSYLSQILQQKRYCFFWPLWDGSSSSSSPAQILQQERYRFLGPFGMVPRLLLHQLRFYNKNGTVFWAPLGWFLVFFFPSSDFTTTTVPFF